MKKLGFPSKQGLYDPAFEHDACGVGFIADIHGKPAHSIIRDSLELLLRLDHRGGAGADPDSGDGAGLLMQIPHALFKEALRAAKVALPNVGQYGVGMLFLPADDEQRGALEQQFSQLAAEEHLDILAWRSVPVQPALLGPTAKAAMPSIRQVFLRRPAGLTPEQFERRLYVLRRLAEKQLDDTGFYAASFSSRTVVYKGMLTPQQLPRFYSDLQDPLTASALALVHSRFSTNTFPSWERAHPTRYLAHNGEINTLRGNVNWMNARQSRFVSEAFGNDLEKAFPVIQPDGSDSAMFDNTLEFLHLNGYAMPHAVMMMIPEPWSNHNGMDPAKRAFYQYHSCLMEPWDGPAVVAFSNGIQIGAALDRNGLRPSRYYVTKDDRVIMASEVGVMDIPAQMVKEKGRLQPGRMLLVDTEAGCIVDDATLKGTLAAAKPYAEWLRDGLVELDSLPQPAVKEFEPQSSMLQRQRAYGYTFEELRLMLTPLARDGNEPVGSMGADTPLAVLSERPQLLYNYFKQLFAQVTNPPIDSIREALITASETYLGSEGDLLSPGPEHCQRIQTDTPILTDGQVAKLRYLRRPGFKTVGLSLLYDRQRGADGLERALEDLFRQADEAIGRGANILLLTDRGLDADHLAVPSLLAVAGLHHHLIRQQTRTEVSIVLESAEPREVHQFAVLLGYGVDAVNPYLAYETLRDLAEQDKLDGVSHDKAIKNYRKAVLKGIIKIMAKMGISAVQSYRGAQIFEAVGIHSSVIDKYFTGTASRIGGIGLDIIAQEMMMRHDAAFQGHKKDNDTLESGGVYQFRRDGEKHLYNPMAIHKLQTAARTNDYALYKEYAQELQEQNCHSLRSLLEFVPAGEPIALDDVEPVAEIVKRFKTGAMSYGSLSQEAHECLAIAMNRLGGRSNSGEGGEDPARFVNDANGDSRCSAIKQVASGRFGVTSEYLVNANELQIKMAQGAKPGEGGQLPGKKVYPWVAKTRHSTPGVGLISPPPHHDIYSIEDLAQLIHDLKNANTEARISVKLVSAVGVGTIAAGVAKGRADVILISGYDGGTGASPRTSIQHAGLPWELGLAETHQTLLLNDLRSRVVLETDGKLMSGSDVAVAALLGAEEFGFATLPLVAVGCVMMRVCNMDTCPVGVATQNPELRKNFKGDPQHVVNLMQFIAEDLREVMADLGFRTLAEMVGQAQRLRPKDMSGHWKARTVDLSGLLHHAQRSGLQCNQDSQDHQLERSLDQAKLLALCASALEQAQPVKASLPIGNTNRVVGTILGSAITRKYGADGLPENTIDLRFTGSAGQSFGAFIPSGLTLRLEGDANDYLGKGMSGGKIVVYPPTASTFAAEENIVTGNVAFYGATSGQAYIRGRAGERFCVRNSGIQAVVEGVGDHGCEYMTGGRVVVLGETGRNFAAGMSGGIAYVWDETGTFARGFEDADRDESLFLETLTDAEEIQAVKTMVQNHYRHTGSIRAYDILQNWDRSVSRFVKVIPKDYKRVIQAFRRFEADGLSVDEAFMAAFEENSSDLARVSGN